MWFAIGAGVYVVVCLLVVLFGDRQYAAMRLVLAVVAPAALYMARMPIAQWVFDGEYVVDEINSGNVFTVRIATGNPQQFELAGTEVPEDSERQQQAAAALTEQIGGRDVSLEIEDVRFGGPLPAIVRRGSVNINELMVAGGFLAGTADPVAPTDSVTPAASESKPQDAPLQNTTSPEAASQELAPVPEELDQAEEWSPWKRYLLWVFLGLLGSTGFGMILAGNPQGWLAFLGVLAGACWSIYSSWSGGTSVWPPVVGLVIVFVFAGNFAKIERLKYASE